VVAVQSAVPNGKKPGQQEVSYAKSTVFHLHQVVAVQIALWNGKKPRQQEASYARSTVFH
jgi:hypothetical protein